MLAKSTPNHTLNSTSKLLWLLKENFIQSVYDYSSWDYESWVKERKVLSWLSSEWIKIRVEHLIEIWDRNMHIPINKKNIESALKEYIDCCKMVESRVNMEYGENSIGEELLFIIGRVRDQQMHSIKQAAA